MANDNEAALRAYLASLRTVDGYGAGEVAQYLDDHWQRFLATVELVKAHCPNGGELLEIGSSPYLLTALIQREVSCRIHTCNYYGPQHPDVDEHRYLCQETGETLRWESRHFDAEEHPYPYPEGTFDVVLACEILEHFSKHPAWMLMEAHRVLKPGGCLILTTPNAVRAGVMLGILKGVNPHDPYSGYGPGGRHNREYTLDELRQWFEASGFATVSAEARDVYPHDFAVRLLSELFPSRRDNLFIVARKQPGVPFRMARPPFLYRGEPFLTKLQHSTVMIGDPDSTQLGEGWWGPETAYGRPGRWSSARARTFLRNAGGATAIRLVFYGGRGAGETVVSICAYRSFRFTHRADEWQTLDIALDTVFSNPNFFVDVNAPVFACEGDRRQLGHYVAEVAVLGELSGQPASSR